MTIDRAIETLRVLAVSPLLYVTEDYRDATNLGIEALKLIKAHRLDSHYWRDDNLPGETK